MSNYLDNLYNPIGRLNLQVPEKLTGFHLHTADAPFAHFFFESISKIADSSYMPLHLLNLHQVPYLVHTPEDDLADVRWQYVREHSPFVPNRQDNSGFDGYFVGHLHHGDRYLLVLALLGKRIRQSVTDSLGRYRAESLFQSFTSANENGVDPVKTIGDGVIIFNTVRKYLRNHLLNDQTQEGQQANFYNRKIWELSRNIPRQSPYQPLIDYEVDQHQKKLRIKIITVHEGVQIPTIIPATNPDYFSQGVYSSGWEFMSNLPKYSRKYIRQFAENQKPDDTQVYLMNRLEHESHKWDVLGLIAKYRNS